MAKITIKDTSRFPDLMKTLEALKRMNIEIGVFGEDDSFMAMLANVHEFGLTIKPKGKFLAIPTENAGDKSPRDFTDLTFISINNGEKGLLVRERKGGGRTGARSEIMFILVRSVKIPERSFIRSTFDQKEGAWAELASKLLDQVLFGDISVGTMLERLGQRIVEDIQETMLHLSPGNAPITEQNKGSSRPLIDSGRLRQSVTYKVVSG